MSFLGGLKLSNKSLNGDLHTCYNRAFNVLTSSKKELYRILPVEDVFFIFSFTFHVVLGRNEHTDAHLDIRIRLHYVAQCGGLVKTILFGYLWQQCLPC